MNFHFSLEFSRFNLLTYVAPEKAKVNAAYYVGKLLPMQCSLTTANGCFHIIIPARRRSSSDGLSDAGLAKGQLYWLHRKGWMATKFTRLQPTWLSCVGCNASGISQTSLKAKDHSGVHCSRSGMTCRRQRSTKLLTTFTNVWMHAPRPRSVVDILNILIRTLNRNVLTELCLLFQKL